MAVGSVFTEGHRASALRPEACEAVGASVERRGRSRSNRGEAIAHAVASAHSESAGSRRPLEKSGEKPHYPLRKEEVLASRYKVLGLLGDGTFGRVVLAHDQREDRNVAVKIIRNIERYAENGRIEAEILREIRSSDAWGLSRCALLLGTFMHRDGFFCLVMEHLGVSLHNLLKQNSYRGYWMQDVQSFALQLLRALRFLHHQIQLTHTDLKLENVLLESAEPHMVSRFPREGMRPRRRGSGSTKTAAEYMRPASNQIKLIDFGNAVFEHESHPTTINTRQYRGPEVILHIGWSERSDLWSVGCMLMELYTGELLFNTRSESEHLALMEKILEPLPQYLLATARSSVKAAYLERNVGPDGETWRLRWPTRGGEGASSSSTRSRRYVATRRRLSELVLESHAALADCAGLLLAADPSSRPSALEALRHPLFEATFED